MEENLREVETVVKILILKKLRLDISVERYRYAIFHCFCFPHIGAEALMIGISFVRYESVLPLYPTLYLIQKFFFFVCF